MRRQPPGAVFTVLEARASGWTDSALRHAVATGRLTRIRRGVYGPPGGITPTVAAIAAARAVPGAVVSHRCAAILHGLPVLGGLPPRPEITVPPRGADHYPAVHLHRAALRPQDVVVVGDVLATSPARTCIDVARHRPFDPAVALIDAALHGGAVEVDELEEVLRFCWNWPRIRRAQRAVAAADRRAESPLESVSRLVLPRLGFPPPETQKGIFDRYGQLVGRGDFYWDEVGVVGEADGRGKYDARAVLTAEKERQEAFEDLGLVVVRWQWEHVWSRQHVLRARIANAFERGRRRDRSGFPRSWTL